VARFQRLDRRSFETPILEKLCGIRRDAGGPGKPQIMLARHFPHFPPSITTASGERPHKRLSRLDPNALIFARLFHAVNDKHFDRPLRRFQLQSELLPDRSEAVPDAPPAGTRTFTPEALVSDWFSRYHAAFGKTVSYRDSSL
jgi:hypothetical protein